MSKLEFHRIYYEKHNTCRINIKNGILFLKEHCEVIKIDYRKAVVQLVNPGLRILMELWGRHR